jgi:methyl-accepting chemotaxis protein
MGTSHPRAWTQRAKISASLTATCALLAVAAWLLTTLAFGLHKILKWETEKTYIGNCNLRYQTTLNQAKDYCMQLTPARVASSREQWNQCLDNFSKLKSASTASDQQELDAIQAQIAGNGARLDGLFAEKRAAQMGARALYEKYLEGRSPPFAAAADHFRSGLILRIDDLQSNLAFKGASFVTTACLALAALVLVFVSVLLLAVNLRHGLLTPMDRLSEKMTALADGDLGQRLEAARADEMGQLSTSFNRTCERLSATFHRSRVDWAGIAQEETKSKALQEAEAARTADLRAKADLMLETIRRAGDGDLTARAAVSGEDALGQAAGGLNRLLDTFSKDLSGLQRNALELDSASSRLETLSASLNGAMHQAVDGLNVLETNGSTVHSNVDSLAAATEEMNTAIHEISSSAGNAAAVASESVRLAHETDETVRKLSRDSAEIDAVVKTITDIARQTNLLALNATIEAARAGVAGKGFAVVASEVKELATGTTSAAEDIRRRIAAIQATSNETVNSIGKVSESIDKINSYQAGIASAVEEQSVTSQEISKSIQTAAGSTREIQNGMASVTEAVKGNSGLAANLTESSRALSQMSTQMKHLVQKFRFA